MLIVTVPALLNTRAPLLLIPVPFNVMVLVFVGVPVKLNINSPPELTVIPEVFPIPVDPPILNADELTNVLPE